MKVVNPPRASVQGRHAFTAKVKTIIIVKVPDHGICIDMINDSDLATSWLATDEEQPDSATDVPVDERSDARLWHSVAGRALARCPSTAAAPVGAAALTVPRL